MAYFIVMWVLMGLIALCAIGTGVFIMHENLAYGEPEAVRLGRWVLRGGIVGFVLQPLGIVIIPVALLAGIIYGVWYVGKLAFGKVEVE